MNKITVKWEGVFTKGLQRIRITKTFEGSDLESIHQLIKGYVKEQEDAGFNLKSDQIKSIS